MTIDNRIDSLMIELNFERDYEKRAQMIEELKELEELRLLRLKQDAVKIEMELLKKERANNE